MRVGLLLAAMLLLALAVSAAAAPPYPVEVEVEARDPLPGGPFYYAVKVTASRDVDVEVKACVRVPGRGWGDWATLWSGRLRAGEARVLQGSDGRAISAAGDYAVLVQVDFYSDQDYAVLGGSTYYASYYVVYVHPYAKTLYKALGEMYEELEANYTRLKEDYDRLAAESERLKSENQQLSEKLAELQEKLERADRAFGLAVLIIAVLAATLAILTFMLAKRRGSGERLLVK